MSVENQGTQQGQEEQQPNSGGDATPPQQQPANQQPAIQAQNQGKTVMLTSKALAERVDRAKRAGHKEALEKLAADAGVSVDDLLKRVKDPPKPQQQRASNREPQRQPQRQNGGRQPSDFDKKFEREKQKMQREKDEIAKKARSEARRARQLEDELDVERVNRQLERIALAEGVSAKEVRGALFYLADHLQDKSQDYRDKFDEAKYFREQLRTERPYLFGETVRPATTGTGAQPGNAAANKAAGNAPPPAPAPGAARQVGADGQKIDARTMSAESFRELLAKRGLNPSAATA